MTEEQTKAEVKKAVVDSFKAWRERDMTSWRRYAHVELFGYNHDAGLLFEGWPEGRLYDEVQAWWDAGQRSTTSPTHMGVRLLGSDAAVATFYMQGSESYPGGRSVEGTWRASVVLVKAEREWKWLHFHYSPLTTSQTERRS